MYGMIYDDIDMNNMKEDILRFMININAMDYQHVLHKFVDKFIVDNGISQRYWHKQIDPDYEFEED